MNDKPITPKPNGTVPRDIYRPNDPVPSAPGIGLGDIYYVLFRHKWKIALISLVGVVAAALVPFFYTAKYQSEAKLFIRYVIETESPGQVTEGDSRTKSPDERGQNIINSELEILTSLDLAQQVAESIGPEKVLAAVGGGNDKFQAAGVIRKNLVVEAPLKSAVIRLGFKHPDRSIVQPVLNALVETYFKRHAEVHRSVGVFDDFLTQETDQLRFRLTQTENALRATMTNAGIISLDDAKKSFSEQLSRLQSEIMGAEAQLAERQATLTELARLTQAGVKPVTNEVAQDKNRIISPEKIAEYKRASISLEGLMTREQQLSLQFTPENAQVKMIREQVLAAEKTKQQLEAEHPELSAVVVSETRNSDPARRSTVDLLTETAQVTALASKIQVLTNQLAQIRKAAAAVDAVEGSITELQRKKELEEGNYKYFLANMEQSRINEALGAGGISNIRQIQAPSPPFADRSKLHKMMAGIFFGAMALALALAFAIEMFLDRTLRRSAEIETLLKLPLFLSIPQMNQIGKSGVSKKVKHKALQTSEENVAPSETLPQLNGESHLPVAPWDAQHELRPFYETLRDRLISYFELINLTHKPKLVAVTSCASGAGVTTTAAGLAACLSQTGDGNVLLVDMNLQQGEAHHFYKGHHLACGLDDALEGDKRNSALVQENLYVVTETSNGHSLPQILPKRFKHLIPKLRASDYDYIIFDMPPVSQISATPRLARFMDMVFVVVESEKTNRDLVKRATSLLAESKTNVGVILNKSRAYVPKRLQHDL